MAQIDKSNQFAGRTIILQVPESDAANFGLDDASQCAVIKPQNTFASTQMRDQSKTGHGKATSIGRLDDF